MIFYRNICLRLITEFLKENQKIVHRIEEGLLQYAHANKNLAWQQALKESNSPMLETTLILPLKRKKPFLLRDGSGRQFHGTQDSPIPALQGNDGNTKSQKTRIVQKRNEASPPPSQCLRTQVFQL